MDMDRNICLFLVLLLLHVSLELPDLSKTDTEPIVVKVQETASLKCSVKNLDNFTIVWKRIKYGRIEVLSANTLRVTNDPRFSVVRALDGDDWILMINQARVSDSAQYICETNSIPAVQVSLFLTVKSSTSESSFPLSHNYTACCQQQDVPASCLGFCSLQNIVFGNTGNTPQNCREHLPIIAGCMADGRNHTPCCVRERIPEVCRDVCVGKFGLINETIVNHYTCSRYSRATLACIAEGIEILPGPPIEVQVEPLSENEVNVSWTQPKQNFETITHYLLNLTELSSFDEIDTINIDYDTTNDTKVVEDGSEFMNHSDEDVSERPHRDKFREIKIDSTATSTVIKNLSPFTMYEIYLISVNSYGTSLSTYRLRTLTLQPKAKDEPSSGFDNSTSPELPNVRACCAEKGMTQDRCLDLFCDPVKADLTNLTDVMICAPWISASVSCLTRGKDHTPCCRQRGLPEMCISLCAGNVTRIDFRFFKCVSYMNSYTNCLMEGYGVLSSSPIDPLVKNVHSTWAILQWKPPHRLTSTVTSYNVHYRKLSAMESLYTVSTARNPFLLDSLEPNTEYEAYVTAVNRYGTSEGSPRVVFQTASGEQAKDENAHSSSSHNVTECCISSRLNSTCMPLCDYRAKMADLQRLASTCMPEFHKLLKCGVAGRNHMPCCMRRMVNMNCASLCAGMVPQFSTTSAAMCIPFIPDIIHCMEEGNEKLPGPVQEFHAVDMNETSVFVRWEAPVNSTVALYELHYQGEIMNSSSDKPSPKEKVLNVTDTFATITDLETGILYSFYVVAMNEYGSSIPSSILTFHTASEQKSLKGVVSPPHSLMTRVRNITSIKISWLPPDFSHPADAIDYKVYYKLLNESENHSFNTTELSTTLTNLEPNTEYVIYVTAITDKGESWPSETLKAWTDTVYPAFVEIPRIHPSTQIEENSSVTVLCMATGTPIPRVGVYLNGIKIVEETTRHMVAIISNISRNTNVVMCTANNGFGPGSHAVKHIQVSFGPQVEARAQGFGHVGHRIVLECTVSGYPEPHMTWWRDREKTIPIVTSQNFISKTMMTDSRDLIMELIIGRAAEKDGGAYYCSAENPYGKAMDQVILKLEKSDTPDALNMSECCHQQNVIPECLDACAFEADIDTLLERPHCIPELNKIMHCAADESDHRRCCQTWGIPRQCIGLCQGKHVQNAPLCILAWSKQIINCFQEGKNVLPGKPRNLKMRQLSATSIFLEWDPPQKNPHVVQFYRVFGKIVGSSKKEKFQNDTHGLSMTIEGLKPDAVYEFVVKAGNHFGASLVSEPLRFDLTSNNIGASTYEESSNTAAIVVGVALTIIIILAFAGGFIYFRRKYRPRTMGGVSFENPSYMREVTGDPTQANSSQEQGSSSASRIPADGWKSETLHATEPPENFYEIPGDKSNGRTKLT